jgi:hypothetical protein
VDTPQPATDVGVAVDGRITYCLTDRQLADVYYRHRRRHRGWVVRLVLSAVVAGGIAAASPWLFAPAEQAPFQLVGMGLVVSTLIVGLLRPGQIRRAILRNVRDNPVLLQPMSLKINDEGLQAPFDSSGTVVPWPMWQGQISEDAAWFYLHLPGVRQPWPVPKSAMDQGALKRFAAYAELRT